MISHSNKTKKTGMRSFLLALIFLIEGNIYVAEDFFRCFLQPHRYFSFHDFHEVLSVLLLSLLVHLSSS